MRLQIAQQLAQRLTVAREQCAMIGERAQRAAFRNDKPARALADDTFREQDGDAAAHRFQRHIERAAELIAADAAAVRRRARDGQGEQHIQDVERRGVQDFGDEGYDVRDREVRDPGRGGFVFCRVAPAWSDDCARQDLESKRVS